MTDPTFTPAQPPPGCAPFRYPADPLQFIAWRDFIVFAIEQPALRQAFSEVTGRRFLPPPRSGLDALIGAATGARDREAETVGAFIEWLNAAHWGEDLVGWQPLLAEVAADA